MKKLLTIFSTAALFAFQACQQDTPKSDVNANSDAQNDQSVLDVDNKGTSDQDSSTVNMEEHTRMNQAAEEADPNR